MKSPNLGIFTLALLSFLAAPLAGQTRAAATGPVAPFSMLLGRWEGPATIDMGPRGTLRLTQREWVHTASGGTVIAVTGQGTDSAGRVVFDAFAVIYPGRDGKPAIRAHRMDGQWVDPVVVLGENGFTWSFPDPRAGQVRYTFRLTPAGEWHEIGERSTDGQAWVPFMEMTLRRIGD
ncbi:MAG: hypothetical protein JNM53_12205 [Gemmatimonadetes bacterium]|nr:hypothetical protein [Gemmatimonadota bacterium]